MSNQSKRSVSRSVVLGALLLLAATASGCGVGLPTAPEVDQTAVNGRSAQATGGWIVVGEDPGYGNETSDGDSFVPDPEIVIPTPGGRPGSSAAGNANGHQKNKWKGRY